ncbi:hypothetical protein CEXT_340981 [Caerostris extrusa]|uniref:Uncharacterized protein n=1 Tax=Caerostris extrusa TaxID=172846 RepID=A0AAV4T7I8_CAEEX|nr:hypothetical protein CEXT_340981 [Caerostris extrusa]
MSHFLRIYFPSNKRIVFDGDGENLPFVVHPHLQVLPQKIKELGGWVISVPKELTYQKLLMLGAIQNGLILWYYHRDRKDVLGEGTCRCLATDVSLSPDLFPFEEKNNHRQGWRESTICCPPPPTGPSSEDKGAWRVGHIRDLKNSLIRNC